MPVNWTRGQPATRGGQGGNARVNRRGGGVTNFCGQKRFVSNRPRFGLFQLQGVTVDKTDTPIPSMEVRLLKTDFPDRVIAYTTSDGSGNFSFTLGTNEGFYWVAIYKAGSPNLAGVSDRNLVATPV